MSDGRVYIDSDRTRVTTWGARHRVENRTNRTVAFTEVEILP